MTTDSNSVTGDAASVQPSTWTYMLAARRWLAWAPDKQPFYVNGTPRRGTLDTDDDRARLASFDEACCAVRESGGKFEGVGFALGPDGSGRQWQGIDLDKVQQHQLSDLANDLPGYVEVSPSGNGRHAIGYGRHFDALGSNGSGIEAYAHGRYFTYTGNKIRDSELVCMAEHVRAALAPRHAAHGQARQAAHGAGDVQLDPRTVSELRSALAFLRADDRDLWVALGQALKETGEKGRGLWWDWSQTSNKCKPEDAKKWDSFDGDRTGYAAVFAKAQAAGWINPASKAAHIDAPVEGEFKFKRKGEQIVAIDYILDPWLPRDTVVGFYGRGEGGKSSFVATMCAWASPQVTTLWITSEENPDHVLQRHTSCGGGQDTLAVLEAVPTKRDPVTKKPVSTTFNVYEHMEPAILAFQQDANNRKDRPLRIVVLDAIVALVTWGKGEHPNDDAGVKRLLAHLVTLGARHGISFVILGHLNKGTHGDHIADAVTGAAAWTNSVRLAFMLQKDLESQNYEGFVRTVKINTGTNFGAIYKTVPVYTLRQRQDGHHDVLCRVDFVSPIQYGELALREMMSGEDGDRLLEKVNAQRDKVRALVETVLTELRSSPSTNRKAAEARLNGIKVSRKHWTRADAVLLTHGVGAIPGEHGELFYSAVRPM